MFYDVPVRVSTYVSDINIIFVKNDKLTPFFSSKRSTNYFERDNFLKETNNNNKEKI